VDVTEVLLHILVVLLAAKAAAEISERIRVPAVVGEIVAGIVIGPSVLGLVGPDNVLRVLGELGVILLLLDVGLEMDLGDLGAVGRSSLTVATVGVVVPFGLGVAAGSLFGMSGKEMVFVGAALTATSVGITARVFGDLRALASVEARTVLGAAVADDVIGLVILTVVTRVVAEGGVAAVSLLGIVAVAVGFLVVTTVLGVRVAPVLFAFVSRHSRSAGTLVAVALAFTLAIAELAHAAKLAPIIGAFVAGLALGRTRSANRIRRELTPVGHLLIPVFFLQIGIDADIGALANWRVLALASVLLLVAVVGKLASAAGMLGAPGDPLLVGIGMIPRGEVGLVFAAIGLREAVFGQDVYAALLLVVLASTLLTPPFLRHRLLHLRRDRRPASPAAVESPKEGWLRERDGVVELVAEPPATLVLEVALEAARRCRTAGAGNTLLGWLGALPSGPLRWTTSARDRFLALLETAGPRSWRLLEVSGVLERALPQLGAAIADRQAGAPLDPIAVLHWPRLAQLQEEGRLPGDPHPERLLLAALVLDATQGEGDAVALARSIARQLQLGASTEHAVAALVADADLLVAASRRVDGLSEEPTLQLAAHLSSARQAEALYALSLTSDDLDDRDRARLGNLRDLLREVLGHPELVGPAATDALELRRAAASALAGDVDSRERIELAPRAYVLAVPPAELAMQVDLCDPLPKPGTVRVRVTAHDPGSWSVDVTSRDTRGLLARQAGVLADHRLDVMNAVAATWGDGCAIATFEVRSSREPKPETLSIDLRAALGRPLMSRPARGVQLDFDGASSPWHTVVTVRTADRAGLLHALTTAFAAAGADVHAARVRTEAGQAVDVFELTDSKGAKLSTSMLARIRRFIDDGVTERRRWLWGRPFLPTAPELVERAPRPA
jgi:Kef-type K+ transport system membrane component KefB